MSEKYIKKVHNIVYHRNGVTGTGFHLVEFQTPGRVNMHAAVFPAMGCVAVLQDDEPSFTWRGDQFEPELRAAIAEWESARAPRD